MIDLYTCTWAKTCCSKNFQHKNIGCDWWTLSSKMFIFPLLFTKHVSVVTYIIIIFPRLAYLVSGSKIVYFQISGNFSGFRKRKPKLHKKFSKSCIFLTFAVTQTGNCQNGQIIRYSKLFNILRCVIPVVCWKTNGELISVRKHNYNVC